MDPAQRGISTRHRKLVVLGVAGCSVVASTVINSFATMSKGHSHAHEHGFVQLLWILSFGSLALTWVYLDARERSVEMGSFLPVCVLLCPVLAVMFYLLRSRGWRGFLTIGLFLLLLMSLGLLGLFTQYVVGLTAAL